MVRNVPCSSIDRAARHQKAPVMPEALQDAAMDRSDAGLFATTQWSLVLRARDKSQAAVSALCGSYWQPAVRWLRARGYRDQDAEDLVQGFLAHALERNFLNGVAAEKGRFRTFLLKCLRNYVADQHDKAAAGK